MLGCVPEFLGEPVQNRGQGHNAMATQLEPPRFEREKGRDRERYL